jgi:hypothetical protein
MSWKDRILKLLGVKEPSPPPAPVTQHLSKRYQRHEFILLQVMNAHVFKVRQNGKTLYLDLGDWRYFKHELLNFCQAQKIWMSALEQGTVQIHCLGMQDNLPRGIKYTWRFTKL